MKYIEMEHRIKTTLELVSAFLVHNFQVLLCSNIQYDSEILKY